MLDKENFKGKIPPQNIEAEQSLLGCIFINNKVLDEIIPIISPVDFYEPKNKKIYEVILELNEKGSAIDILTVTEALRVKNWLDIAGGASYIASLPDVVPTSENAVDYAEIVRDKAILRSLIDTSTAIIQDAYNEEKDPKIITEEAIKKIFDATERQKKDSIVHIEDLVDEVYERIKMRGKNPNVLIGLPTGFKIIDNALSGLQPQELIIIAARPSLGKTSLALNIAYNLAVKDNRTVLFFSFEMGKEILVERLLAIGTKLNLSNLRKGKIIKKEDNLILIEVSQQLAKSQILIDTDDNTVHDIRAKINSVQNHYRKMGKKLDLVIIDYLQLIRPSDTKISREQQIAHISRYLKAIARDLEIPVIALSQLNRDIEKRERSTKKEKRIPPRLSDLRESGAIEQDADVVMFIDKLNDEDRSWLENYEDGTQIQRKVRECKFIIAKNRNGPLAEQEVNFLPEVTLFCEKTLQDTEEKINNYEATSEF